MPGLVYDYDPPDRFVAGTVGEPGQRSFYLQASGNGRITTVALEKQQVAALAERINDLLDEVLRISGGTEVPALTPQGQLDMDPLGLPLSEDFRVGTMALAWDGDAARLVIEAHALLEDDADADEADDAGPGELAELSEPAGLEPEVDDGPPPDLLRVRIAAAAARAFAERAVAVVNAGRPNCPFCGLPLDPTGHICPRQNGYRRR
jgi:uncharacterized repeat protein (TIGR03847 family)